MFAAIDNWIIARFQSLVNLFQHKPMWWIEQCSYILLITAIGRLFYRSEPLLFKIFFFLLDMLVVVYVWIAGHHEEFAARVFGKDQTLFRNFFLTMFVLFTALDVLLVFLGGKITPISVITDFSQGILVSVFYFGACDPPPPPQPKTKMAFNGSQS